MNSTTRIYANATVVTMAESFDDARRGVVSTVHAFGVEDGRIACAGTLAEVIAVIGSDAEVVDLNGATVVPGFIDAHSHFPAGGYTEVAWTNISSPPVGRVTSVASLIDTLQVWADRSNSEWVLGRGYDQTLLTEGRHPSRNDLDRITTDKPVFVWHASGHMGVANSRALALAGIVADTPDPTGGFIERDRETGEPTGLMQETAVEMVTKFAPPLTAEDTKLAVQRDVKTYASAGVTTSIIAGGSPETFRSLQLWRAANLLPLRMIMMQWTEPTLTETEGFPEGHGDDWVSLGPWGESVHDGSLQGYTGYLTEPYHYVPADSAYDQKWCGFPIETCEVLSDRITLLFSKGLRSAIHANGDAAIDDVIAAYEQAEEAYPREDARWRIEHAQTIRPDQLRTIADRGISPSYFVSHVFYWGDQHRDIFLGPDRARRISPLKSSLDMGIRFSIHLDSPVVPMSPLHAVWCAVNRLTRSGEVLGPDERISPHMAIRAITIDAAWQNFLEHDRGSIEVGKFADFVVLDENPFDIDPTGIKDIKPVKVYVAGAVVN